MSVGVRRSGLAVLCALGTATACAGDGDRGSRGDRAELRALRTTNDPVVASTSVRALASESCDGLVTATAALGVRAFGARRFDARTVIGLVDDAVTASRGRCSAADALDVLAGRPNPAAALARAQLIGAHPGRVADALALAPPVPAVMLRRAEVIHELGHEREAVDAIEVALAFEDDAVARSLAARLAVRLGEPKRALALCGDRMEPALIGARAAALAGLERYGAAVEEIARAPAHLRDAVAREAVELSTTEPLALAAADGAPVEVLVAVAERELVYEPMTAVDVYERAAALAADDADVAMAHAVALERVGRAGDSVREWDRAALLAPAVERTALEPIRLLAASGDRAAASRRAAERARSARRSGDADALRVASSAAVHAGDRELAVALAREALRARPDDGRLTQLLATRLRQAGDDAAAAAVLARLLVCGAHGRPWHRHEIAGELAEVVGNDSVMMRAGLDAVDCAPVEPADLAGYLERVGAGQ